MPYVTKKDFAKLAKAVAVDFVEQDISLNDSIQKLAGEMSLTQEQVNRLCEATNNATFTHLFESRDKTAKDRMIEFDVADSSKVFGEQIKKAAATQVKTATGQLYELRELDDVMHYVRNPEPEAPMEKVAFELRPEAAVSRETDLRTVTKMRDHLHHEKLAHDREYLDLVHDLQARFKRVYDVAPFADFEKAASALYGHSATPHLTNLRSLLGLPEATYNVAVLQKTAGYVDDSSHELQLFRGLLKCAEDRKVTMAALAKLEALL